MQTAEMDQGDVLVLGIGNFLMGDEGVGVHVVHALMKEDLPPGVDVLDGGTGGYQLLGQIQNYRRVIMIDASLDEYKEGHVRSIEPRFATDFPSSLSAHDIGLKELIDSLVLLDAMPKITLIAISIKDLSRFSTELSPPVREAAGRSITLIKSLLTSFQLD